MRNLHIVTALFILVSCSEKMNEEERKTEERMPAVTTEVMTGEMHGELVLNGDVACDERKLAKIYVPCTGKIQHIQVEIGDKVRKGQTLASVYSTDAAEYVKQADEIKSRIRVAERNLSQQEDLYADGMIAEKSVQEAREDLKILNAELVRLENVAKVNGFSKESTANLSSPINGFVVSKTVFNDSYIDATNNDTPAFEIADISAVWIIADVYESDIWKVNAGDSVTVSVSAYPKERFCGVINKVYDILDNMSKTMKVRICLDNKKGLLKPGMFASVHISISNEKRTMLQVPISSIVFENGHDYVVVCDQERKLRRQKVSVAGYDEKYAFISSGVNKGDMIVSENALLEFEALR